MTLLSPIPAIIAAAITVPILITFFLLKLRRRPVRVGSTMLWDQAVQDLQANVPFRWLRPSWLLLLSILILALLLAALARPAIDAGASRADLVILIIDRSASMSATDADDGQSRLNEAKRRARAFVASLRKGGFSGMASAITYASEPRSIASPTRDLSAIERAIDAIEPSDQPANLVGALALAETQIAMSRAGSEEGEAAPSAIAVVYSDAGEVLSEPLAIAGASPRFERIAPQLPLNNVAITAISATRDFEDPTLVRAFVRIQSTDPGAGLTVSFTRDAELIGRQPISFDPPSTGDSLAERPLTFEFLDSAGGLLLASIDRPDALASDDTAGLYLPPPTRPAIVVVRDGPPSDAARFILDTVLRELRPRSLEFITSPLSVSAREQILIRSADLVVLDGVALPQSIQLDAPIIAFGIAPSQIVPPDGPIEPPTDSGATDVVSWDREHPIMRGVSMDAVVVSRGIALPDDDGFHPLAMGRNAPLISLWSRPRADVLLVGFDLYYSNWIDAGLPIFLANAVEYLTSSTSANAIAYRTGELIRLLPQEGATRITLTDDTGEMLIDRAASDPMTPVALGVIDRVGVYAVGGATIPTVAVNLLSQRESAIASRPELRIGGQVLAGSGEGEAAPTEIWTWLVIAAAVLLTLEWLLYAMRMRV